MGNEKTRENLRELSGKIGRSCVCFNLRKTTRLLSQVYDQALKPIGLKGTQFTLMMSLAEQDGVTIGRLARPLGLDRTSLSRNARLLEKKGLVEISEGDDRREQVLKLTDKGNELLQEAIPLWETVQNRIAEEIGENKLNQLLGDLRELVNRIKP